MSNPSPEEFRELVRSHTDIVGLIGEVVSLQPRHGGREYVGLCCFHDDRNPSLTVTPARQTFRCWACNTGGDCFRFLMEREKVGFPEALEILARRANLPIPQRKKSATPEEESNRAKMFEVLQWAENEFHRYLLEAPQAEHVRQYAASRNLGPEIQRQYRLGFHPEDSKWLLNRAEGRYSPQLLLGAQLIGKGEWGYYDNFRNRLMFPIHNERGQVVAFGGRVLPGSDDKSKYWNSPESPVFHKSRILYSLNRARDPIIKRQRALIVEGYTACIACQSRGGFPNAVATLGTALTDAHVLTLKRFTNDVVLVFDGDEAGRKAAAKSAERFLAQNLDLRILTLPDNQDPDDYLSNHSAEEFEKLVDSAPDAWEHQFCGYRQAHGIETLDGKRRIIDDMLALLLRIPGQSGSLQESLYIAKLAHRLFVKEETVRARLEEIRGGQKKVTETAIPTAAAPPKAPEITRLLGGRLTPDDRLECDLLEILLVAPECLTFAGPVVLTSPMRNRILAEILRTCFEISAEGEVSVSRLLNRLPERDLQNVLVWIVDQANAKDLANKLAGHGYNDDGCPTLLYESLIALRRRHDEQLQARLSTQLAQPTDGEGELDAETADCLRQLADLHHRRATAKTNIRAGE